MMSTATTSSSTVRRDSNWIVNAWYDSTFFILSPLLALVLGMCVSGSETAQRSFMVGEYSNSIAHFSIGVFIMAHLWAVFLRSHLNPSIFAAHRLRFTVVPFVLLIAMQISAWFAVALTVLATWWDVYHSSLQTFGIGRIYDMRSGNDSLAGRQIDRWFNLLLYAGPILAGATLMDHVDDFDDFESVNSVFFSAIPVLVESNREILTWFVLLTGIPFALYYCYSYRRLYRNNYRFPPQKLALLVSTGLVSIYSWGFNTFGEAFFIMNFFHALQYFALVWWSERKNLVRVAHVADKSWGPAFAMALFFGFALVYGIWAEMIDTNNTVFFNLVIVVALMHFWYDGFIWSVRKKQV